MCNRACIDFGRSHLTTDHVAGRRVLEVGALDVNGSLRPVVQAMGPSFAARYRLARLLPGRCATPWRRGGARSGPRGQAGTTW